MNFYKQFKNIKTMEERDLSIATEAIMKMNETTKARTRARLTAAGYRNLDTDEGLIDAYDLDMKSPQSAIGLLIGIMGIILIVFTLISMF